MTNLERMKEKTLPELLFIMQDAREAADAMRGWNPQAEAKYLDQINDASTELYRRRQAAQAILAAA